MDTQMDKTLSAIDRFTERIGPLSFLVDAVVKRVVPRATALAANCPPLGYVVCGYSCVKDGNCGLEGGCATMWTYVSNGTSCNCSGPCFMPTCTACDGGHCGWFSC